MINIFRLPDSLKRRLSPKIKALVKSGYLNEELRRTKTGSHIILNFLEEKFDKEFTDWVKDKVKEAEKEEKE